MASCVKNCNFIATKWQKDYDISKIPIISYTCKKILGTQRNITPEYNALNTCKEIVGTQRNTQSGFFFLNSWRNLFGYSHKSAFQCNNRFFQTKIDMIVREKFDALEFQTRACPSNFYTPHTSQVSLSSDLFEHIVVFLLSNVKKYNRKKWTYRITNTRFHIKSVFYFHCY